MRRSIASFLVPVLAIFLVLSVAGNVFLYLRYSSQRPLITVNNDVIRKKDLDDRINYLYGDQVLQKLIWNRLIDQEAMREKCLPTDQDVTSEMSRLDRTNPSVIDSARLADPTLTIFKEDLRNTMAIRNLRIAGISVTDQEALAYYNAHKDQFSLPVQAHTTTVVAKDQLTATTARDMLADGTEPAILATKDGMAVVGINATVTGSVPANINAAVLKMQPGQVGIFPVGSKFMVVRIDKRSPAVVEPYDSVKDQVQIAARLEKAPPASQILNGLVERARIHADSAMYANAIPTASQDSIASADN